MRKKLLAAALAAGLALTMTACGGDSSNSGGSTGGEGDSGKVAGTLSMAIWDKAQKPSVEKIIKEFQKTNPDVQIDISVTPFKEYWSKLRTAAEGKNLPDLFWMNGPNIELYALNGQLADLTDLTTSGKVDMSNYPEGLQNIYTVQDKVWGIPKDYDTIGIWYHKSLFEQAGVAEPTGDWTWDEYKAVLKELKEKLPAGVWPMTAPIAGDGQQTYYNTIAQAGGYVIKDGQTGFKDEKTIKGLQFWSDLIRDGYTPDTKIQTEAKPRSQFEQKKAAMYWSGSWELGSLQADETDMSDVKVVALPKDEKQGTVIHGLAWAVANNSENMAAAKAFVAFAGTKEAQEIQAEDGQVIPAFKGTGQIWVKSAPHEDMNLQVFIDGAENYSIAYPVSKNTAAWADKFDETLNDSLNEGADMTEPCHKMAEIMEAALAKEK